MGEGEEELDTGTTLERGGIQFSGFFLKKTSTFSQPFVLLEVLLPHLVRLSREDWPDFKADSEYFL